MATDFTIADVLAWARTKPASEAYNYESNRNCALCQFLRETGRCADPSAGGDYWRDTRAENWSEVPLPSDLVGPLCAGTFGGLVARLEKLAPETPITRSNWSRLDAYMTDIELASA